MRRLILEFSINDLKSKNVDLSLLRNVKTLEVLQLLRQDEEETAAIGRIEVEDEVSNIEDYFKLILGNTAKVQLDREKGGAYIIFAKHKMSSPPLTDDMKDLGVYTVSHEIKEGKLKLTILGDARQLRVAFEKLEKSGTRFKIVSSTDAKFPSDSPLNILTEKQRRVLTTAYALGYYDTPRKIDSEQLAKRLKLKRSTLVVHRRKAEQRILTQMLKQ